MFGIFPLPGVYLPLSPFPVPPGFVEELESCVWVTRVPLVQTFAEVEPWLKGCPSSDILFRLGQVLVNSLASFRCVNLLTQGYNFVYQKLIKAHNQLLGGPDG